MKRSIVILLAFLASTASPAAESDKIPAGDYTLDRAHASLLFRVDHLGFSHYTARFTKFDAQLYFDPAHPETARVTAMVDARSLETDYPDPRTIDFNAQLQTETWLNTAAHPTMRFQSTAVHFTAPDKLRIEGRLTLRGITHPFTLYATYNGGYAGHPLDPHARIGFSARGSLLRSGYGMDFGIPTPEFPLGVSDEVEVIIEAEFNGPPWAGAEATVPHSGPAAPSL